MSGAGTVHGQGSSSQYAGFWIMVSQSIYDQQRCILPLCSFTAVPVVVV